MRPETANLKGLFNSNPCNACTAYKNVRNGKKGFLRKARQHCEDLWSQYESYADPHFLDEFPRRFHQRWFEMYLTVSLIQSDFDIQCPKPGPDILLKLNGRRMWIEAVCATRGEESKMDSVPKLQMNSVDRVPMDQCVLRVTQSLKDKSEKYKDYLRDKTVCPEDLLVIAINVRSLNAGPHVHDVFNKAVYGLGDLVARIGRDSGSFLGMESERVPSIPKKSGAEVGTQPLLDGSLPHISALWAFDGDAANLPKKLGEDCVQHPNLSGSNRWPEGLVTLGEEWYFQTSGESWIGRKQSHDGARL